LLLLLLLVLVACSTAAIEKVKEAILADAGALAAPPGAAPAALPLKPLAAKDKASKMKTAFEQSEALIGYWQTGTPEDGAIVQISDYNDPDILQMSDPAGALGAGDVSIPLRGQTIVDGLEITSPKLPGCVCTMKAAGVVTCVLSGKTSIWHKIGGIPLAASANNDFPEHSVWVGTSAGSGSDPKEKPVRLDMIQNIGFAIGIVAESQSYIHHLNGRIAEQRLQNNPTITAPHWGYLSADHSKLYTSLGETFDRDLAAPDGNIPEGGFGCNECTTDDDCKKYDTPTTTLTCFGVKFTDAGAASGRCCF